MSEELTKVVIDCSTGEEQIIPLTPEEITQLEFDRITWEEQRIEFQTELEAKEAARQSGIAKLLALGLTEEEANALTK